MMADYDCEEVQPHGQDEIGADAFRSPDFPFLVFFISHALHVARLSWLGARDAYTTTVKIPMYKRTLSKGWETPYQEIVAGLL
jgi:hypothetical protein